MLLTTRKRAPGKDTISNIDVDKSSTKNGKSGSRQVPIPESDVLDSDDLDYKPDEKALKKSAMSETFLFLGVIACMAILITAINMYNVHQLERLKEEYGHGPDKDPDLGWWETGIIYQIYTRSFMDSNGDGMGDIAGIRQRLDYLQNLGVTTLLLAPIFLSAMKDFGSDITDFRTVDPKLGTNDELIELMEELHRRDMKLVLDIIPNHSSDQHPWFEKDRNKDYDGPYKDYYIWHEGRQGDDGSRKPPSNWLSKYGGPAWTWDDKKEQYYLHQYHSSMPDLNYRNPKVREELVGIVKFWIQLGIDGFRLVDAHLLFESEDVALDEPENEFEKTLHDPSDILEHIYTIDQPEIHEVTSTLHELSELHGSKLNKHILFLVDAEGDTIKELMRYYFTGADAPMTLNLLNVGPACGGKCVQNLIETWTEEMPDARPIYWSMSRPHHHRAVTRKGAVYGVAMFMLTMTLPGTAIMMYGDELGLPDLDQSSQVHERIESRILMPWNNRINGGFSMAERTWIPLSGIYKKINVDMQQRDKSENSPLHVFKKITRLKQEPAFKHGKHQYAVVNDNIISYVRFSKDTSPYLIAVNIGLESSTDNYMESIGYAHGKVVVNTGNFDLQKRTATSTVGSKIHLQDITLGPGQGIIVKLEAETFYEVPDILDVK